MSKFFGTAVGVISLIAVFALAAEYMKPFGAVIITLLVALIAWPAASAIERSRETPDPKAPFPPGPGGGSGGN